MFPGHDSLHQIQVIVNVLGPPGRQFMEKISDEKVNYSLSLTENSIILLHDLATFAAVKARSNVEYG